MATTNNVINSFEKTANIFKNAVLDNATVMNMLRTNSPAQLTHTSNVFSCKDSSGNPMELEYTVTVRRIK